MYIDVSLHAAKVWVKPVRDAVSLSLPMYVCTCILSGYILCLQAGLAVDMHRDVVYNNIYICVYVIYTEPMHIQKSIYMYRTSSTCITIPSRIDASYCVE